jgi:signal transduction histidine kinase
MDIGIVITKGLTYAVILVVLSGAYLGLIFGANKYLGHFVSYNPTFVHFLIFLILLVPFIYFIPRFKYKAEKRLEKAIYKDKYEYRDILTQFARRLVLIPEVDDLLDQTIKTISRHLGVNKISIGLVDEKHGNFTIRTSLGLDKKRAEEVVLSKHKGLLPWLAKNKKAFIREEREKIVSPREMTEIDRDLRILEATVALPLLLENRILGILALGDRVTGEIYSTLDIELLETLTSQMALSLSYKRLSNKMFQTAKLASLGTLAAGIAHEIRNPLSSIQAFAQLLPEKHKDKEFREEFGKIVIRDTKRITQLIENILALARPTSSTFHPCSISSVINDTLLLMGARIKKSSVKVVKKYAKVPKIIGDKEQLKQVFLNIFMNAVQAMAGKEGSQLEITTRSTDKFVRVEIADNGPGIKKENVDRLFDPFFTTRHEGIGLGLALCYRIIEEHKGTIEVSSQVGKGTVFFVNLVRRIK